MKLSDLQPRVVRLLEPWREEETPEERRKRLYAKTVKWRARVKQERAADGNKCG